MLSNFTFIAIKILFWKLWVKAEASKHFCHSVCSEVDHGQDLTRGLMNAILYHFFQLLY